MTADGRLVLRHVVVRAVELAIRSGAAGAAQYFKSGGQAWAPFAANRALAKVRRLEHKEHRLWQLRILNPQITLFVSTHVSCSISLLRNCASLQGQSPASPSAGSNRKTHGANMDATCLRSSALAIAYCLLIPLWVVPLYATFWMAFGSVNGCKNAYDYFYCWTCIYWVW
ncbi:unnamed protein product, partial [Ectocarpus sp. 4 AP-2014]